jgi:hypothetical protein
MMKGTQMGSAKNVSGTGGLAAWGILKADLDALALSS